MHKTVWVMMGLALLPIAARADTIDEVIAKHVAARGGAAALKAITSVSYKGRFRPAGFDGELTYSETIARGGRVRMNFTLQGLTVVQSYDGKSGWQIQPFQGRKDPEKLSADDSKELADDADIDGPLVDYKTKGSKVDYLGTEDVDGTATYKLRLTEKSGDEIVYYIDVDTFMTIRTATKRLLRGREENTVSDFGDYERVAGVYFPFEITSGAPGAPDGGLAKVQLTRGEANLAIDDAKFHMNGK